MPVVPSLKDLAIKTLQHYVDCIVDVGCLEPVSVRACLINAGRRTLVQIEDGTRYVFRLACLSTRKRAGLS